VPTPHESGASGIQVSYSGETCVKNMNSTINDICPPGHYCPRGSESPVQCPPGTNSSSTGLVNVTDCPPCTQGFYCPLNGTVYAVRQCLANHYCPSGTGALGNGTLCPTGAHCPTGSPAPVICGAGTYQDEIGKSTCKACPAGFYCLRNTTSPVQCPPGSYCPVSTPSPTEFLCPNGTYSAAYGLKNETQCIACTPGYFCGAPGSTEPTAKCREGYFCGGGSSVATPHQSGASGIQVSYTGETCVKNMNSTINDICPPGHYCPRGSESPVQCPPGTNSSSTGLVNVTDCPPCTQGFYCPLNGTVYAVRQCLADYYCPSGTGALGNGTLCPTGAHCPTGSPAPVICGAGTYQDEIGKSTCKTCPAGFYCLRNTTSPVQCPPGSYCPAGTKSHTEFLCPNGTYSALYGRTNVTQCTTCTPGYYCGEPGLTEPSAKCREGYFCGGGSSVATPHESGKSGLQISYVGETCVESLNTTINDICPPGHYCPRGSESPVQCPPGTNSSSTGLVNVTDCPPCTQGFYCPLNGTVYAVRQCLANYYCPSGTGALGNGTLCPTGAHCPTGSPAPVICGAGSYQDEVGKSTCRNCPAGSYCLRNTTTPVQCPPGSYCPVGTPSPTTFLCPNGTYSASYGLMNVTQCTTCTPGYYCGEPGLTAPTARCREGYFCGGGSSVASPHESGASGLQISYTGETCVKNLNSTVNDICPPGHYCPRGSESPVQCPPGTNSSSTGLVNITNCPACVEGFYCPHNGTVVAVRKCLAGYFCPPGTANVGNVTHLKCPIGAHCPIGSSVPTVCPAGEYQDQIGQATCKDCPAGFYCLRNSTTPVACPPGSYCPARTQFATQSLCPNGTYSASYRLKNATQCTPCTPGYYCGEPGLTAPTGKCREGYFCGGSSSVATPHESGESGFQVSYIGETCVESLNTTINDICPPGHYCPRGSESPVQCPPGTNSSSTGLVNITDCPDCTRGFYCPLNGTVYAVRPCLEGYFCPPGTANVGNVTELLCPKAHMCPFGSAEPTPCSAGTYQDEIGQEHCKECPAGSYCLRNTTTPFACPPGSYCPAGTSSPTEFLCPNGTYSDSYSLHNDTQCTPCTPGYYCGEPGLTAPTAKCREGYFCGGGSSVATPHESGATGIQISYTGETCVKNMNSTINDICPPGHYCPEGSDSPVQCPPGTNSSSTGLSHMDQCPPCHRGFYCPLNGTVVATRKCLPGYYCPSGTANPSNDSSLLCPNATMCPLGSAEPTVCAGGYYQNEVGRATCKICPPGFVCPEGTVVPRSLCPVGQFCLAGSYRGAYCANGTYGATEGLLSQNECSPCPARYYCTHGNITDLCSAGYFCKTRQGSPAPAFDTTQYSDTRTLLTALQALDGGPCFPGAYCPQGTGYPLPCANSTVRANAYGDAPSSCGPCPAGYTCAVGNPVPEDCAPGKYCPEGQSAIDCPRGRYQPYTIRSNLDDCLVCPPGFFCNATSITSYTHWPCPTGHFCLNGTTQPLDCPSGTFRNTLGAAKQGDCFTCPPGRYCPEKSSIYLPCPAGYYCPTGASNYTLCPPGYVCGANTSQPLPCPESYYCPLGTSVPKECYFGTYCPTGTDFPQSCPLGYRAVSVPNNTLSALVSLQDGCEPCPPKYYGTDSRRLKCSIGTPGYYFLGGTTTDKPVNISTQHGARCPVGHYCPEGSDAPAACPAGTFLPYTGASNRTECDQCPLNTYQYNEGSSSCFKCSSSSISESGSSLCTCSGQNRVFQPEDGFCICKPGYEFVDANLKVSSENDGAYDCQPIVRARCAQTEVRLFDGSCAAGNSYCASFCGDSGGVLSSTTGTCVCNNITTLAEVCDADCRAAATSVTCSDSGELVATDPTTGETTPVDPDSIDMEGSIDCSVAGSSVYSMSVTDGRFKGYFGTNDALTSAIESRRRLTHSDYSGWGQNRSVLAWSAPEPQVSYFANLNYTEYNQRRLATSSDPALVNPVVSISVGDTIVFDVTNNNYPVYVKDSTLNTNPDFDYSSFRALAAAVKSSLTISTFSFTFSTAGTYVFRLSSSATAITIITVLADNVARSTDAQFVESSTRNLIVLGVKTDDSIVVAPDWNLVIGLLLGMLALVLLVIGFLYYFRKRSWSHHAHIDPKYRQKNKNVHPEADKKTKKGGGWFSGSKGNKVFVADSSEHDKKGLDSPNALTSDVENPAADDEDLQFDDEMLIPELAKHMQSHHDEIDRQLINQNDLLSALQDTLKKEVDELKSLLSTTAQEIAMGMGSEGKNKRLHGLLLQLRTDTMTRGLYESEVDTTDKRILALIEQVRKTLSEGSKTLGNSIVHEIVQQAIDLSDRDEPIHDLYSHNLQDLVDSLNEVREFTNDVLVTSLSEEKRRSRAAEEAFDAGVRNLRDVSFPQEILDKLKFSRDADVDTDVAYDDILTVLRKFSDNIPKFVAAMRDAESNLGRGLARTVEKGNQSLIEKEQNLANQKFNAYLDDLFEAVKVLTATVSERMQPSNAARVRGMVRREELIAAIDAALRLVSAGGVENDQLQQMLEPLLAALREAGTLGVSAAPGAASGAPGPDDVVPVTSMPEDEPMADQRVVDTVLENENLTEDQKAGIIGAADNDMKVMESLIELERKRQEDAILQAISLNEQPAVESDTEDVTLKHEAEQQALMASLLVARNEELDRLMSGLESTDTEEGVQEKRVHCLARSSYAAFMRYWSAHATLSYREMHMHYQLERINVEIGMYDAGSPISRERGEKQLADLTDEEAGEVEELSKGLHAMLQAAEQDELAKRSAWTKQPESVDVIVETEKIIADSKERFATLRTRLQDLSGSIREHCKLSGVLTLAMLSSRKSKLEESVYNSMLQSAKAEIETSKDAIEALQEDDLRILGVEESQLMEVLAHATAWDSKSDERSAQSQLHLRELAGIQVNASIKNRLGMVEFELKADVEQIRTTTELLRRGADKGETDRVLGEVAARKLHHAAKLAAEHKEKLSKITKSETDRHSRADVNYERERAAAFEQNAYREIKVSTQLARSLHDIRRSVEVALAEKRAVMLNAVKQNTTISEDLKRLTAKQIEVEAIREELDLRAAYGSVEEGYTICERYLCEVVQGIEPSISFVQQQVRLYNAEELHLLEEAVYMEDARRKLKKHISAYTFKDFEANRLRALGRSEKDIHDLFEDVDRHTREGLNLIEVSTASELWRLKSLYTTQLEDKSRVHKQYEGEVAKLSEAYAQRKLALRVGYDSDRQLVKDNAETSRKNAQVSPEVALFELQRKYTQSLFREEQAYCESLYHAFKGVMAKIVTEEASGDELRVLRQRLNKDTSAEESALETSTTTRLEELLQAQKTRRDKEAEEFRAANQDFTARAEELAQKEDEESVALRNEVLEKEQQSHRAREQAHNAIIEAANGASKASKRDTEEELKTLREQYDQDIARLEDSLKDKATKEKTNLQKRLAAKRTKRVLDLKAEGRSESEAQAQVASEEEKAMEDLTDKLEADAAEAVATKRREALEAERKLIAREHELATQAANNAQMQKDAAQEHMRKIREQHEHQARQLESDMVTQRKSQESHLRSRLAERRAGKLRDVTDPAARQQQEAALQQEELESMLAFQKQAAAEEERKRAEVRAKQEAEEAEALEALKRAEIETAKTAAKEAALRAFKEFQTQAEEDINLREVQRMREVHERQEEKRRAEQEQQQKAGKGKLEERLQAKRQKRERELREQERQQLEELQVKQKAEAEEKERNRVARMAWSEKVQEVIEKAKRLGMSDLERENYCFEETLGKNMVPDKQLSEAVNLIQKERHDAEMIELLRSNFEERIFALKTAVERLIEEKSRAKVDAVESLASNGASEASIQLEIAKLDAEYNKRQQDVEREATGKLEPVHLKYQMELRQKQLEEVANVVSLYADPATLARLQSSTGRTQEEELLAYRKKIEDERRAREEAIQREREQTEQRLREQHEAEVRKIAEDLETEKRKAEAEYERKKREMDRQKEEMDRRQQNEMGEMDIAQKAKILSNFEKEQAAMQEELDATRRNTKSKLADRLSRRRSNAVGGAPAGKPSEQLVMSAAAVQGAPAAGSALSLISNKIAALSGRAADGTNAALAESPALAQSMNLIEAKLERIERVITTLERNGIKTSGGAASTAEAPAAPVYQDKDEPAPGETLEVVADSDMPMQEMARIEFGKRIAAMIGLKTLSIRAASSLPPSQASNNAFSNSYFYSIADNTLLVHSQRLSSSGDFGLIVIHALSHIKVCHIPFAFAYFL
jgi:hypothetical protein